jgi:outer membrane protein OmpA-like peptidoglycan-associated protein
MAAIRIGVLVVLLAIPAAATGTWISSAKTRLAEMSATPAEAPPVAAAADVGYCSPELKKILRRVLMSCGLVGGEASRGCQPVQAKNVATMSGSDFNALFRPMKDRGGIFQFELDKAELDPADIALVDQVFADQRGASWFFVVARASPEGSVTHNRDLSKARAEAVMAHLRERFKDPDLDKEVGLLWLGEEFAQLEQEFCDWKRSATGTTCTPEELNRSAFVAWIDCQL